MPAMTDTELYARGAATLAASWAAYGAEGDSARLHRLPGVVAAVFPDEPERSVYNNALLDGEGAIEAMQQLYADAGIERFAAWVHESDHATQAALGDRGYAVDTATRVMAMPLRRLVALRHDFEIGEGSMDEHVRTGELPPGLLARADHAAFRVLIARVDEEQVATALAFEHEGDCGIYNVGTREPFRRRGIGAAITALALRDAQERGCTTASLQATPEAEGVYRALGFRDLGRYVEYVPSTS